MSETRQVVRAGEAFVQPPGTAHQIINTGQEDFVFYIIADNSPTDYGYYPDSKKWALKSTRIPSAIQRKVFRMTEVDYFDGED